MFYIVDINIWYDYIKDNLFYIKDFFSCNIIIYNILYIIIIKMVDIYKGEKNYEKRN